VAFGAEQLAELELLSIEEVEILFPGAIDKVRNDTMLTEIQLAYGTYDNMLYTFQKNAAIMLRDHFSVPAWEWHPHSNKWFS
jgi:beta-glucanase (GH16 family)